MIRRGAFRMISCLGLTALLSYVHAPPAPPPEENTVRSTIRDAEYYLSVCDFRKALNTFSRGHTRHPGNDTLRAGYIRALERIRTTGDEAFAKEDYGTAGHIYFVLLEKVRRSGDIGRHLSFSGEYLGERIRISSKTLTEHGLVQYRGGNLGEAIAIWERVVIFDPGNREVKKAIETATTQLENLNALP